MQISEFAICYAYVNIGGMGVMGSHGGSLFSKNPNFHQNKKIYDGLFIVKKNKI